jgi:glycosyltransferase involved in cell wall biosynthesis
LPGCPEIAAYDLFHDLNESGMAEASFLGCVTSPQRPGPSDCALQTRDGSRNEYLLHVDNFDPFMLAHGIDSRALDEFSHFLDSIKPDLVHFHHLHLIGAECLAVVRNRLPNARIVFSLFDFHPICHRDGLMMKTRSDALCSKGDPEDCHACFPAITPGRFSLRRDHLQNMLGLVDRFITPNVFSRHKFAEWGVPDPLIEWIPSGLPEDLRPLPEEENSHRNRFGFFGNIAPHKGALVALDALKHIDPTVELTLTLHGAFPFQTDDFSDAFDQALEREGDRARYAGPYTRSNIAQRMRDGDWVIVPSNWWESASLTILESFRLGRPVIAGDIGGMGELVDHGVNGFQFPRNDPAALARVMKRAASEEGLWSRMAASLPDVPMISDITARHLALYNDLIMRSQRKMA